MAASYDAEAAGWAGILVLLFAECVCQGTVLQVCSWLCRRTGCVLRALSKYSNIRRRGESFVGPFRGFCRITGCSLLQPVFPPQSARLTSRKTLTLSMNCDSIVRPTIQQELL